ncbi:MAG TPA: Xaa-Pro peptidase family protein [Geobacterales bacterium]|nr:Xaa-Pro peptidase family protein [Geobacterales bacterium]
MVRNRVAAARNSLEQAGVQFLLITDLRSIRYLCGFTGSDGVLLLNHQTAWFLTDSRYTTQARQQVFDAEVLEYRAKLDGVMELLSGEQARSLAFEPEQLTVAFLDSLREKLPGVELVPLATDLAELRRVKDSGELLSLERIATLASDALRSLLPQIQPGVRERDLALDLEYLMRRAGADDRAFDFIVASGERGAMPHGRGSEKPLARGELVTIDFGALLDGYHSDETVTVAVAEVSSEQRRVYQVVKDAHDRAIDAVRPGVTCKELDAVARDYIAAQGYGDYFGHGLGHGVGLNVHERPVISPRGSGLVEEGMVFTIEPGIYIPGWGGVRIEDMIAVTADGCRLLTTVSKELQILG